MNVNLVWKRSKYNLTPARNQQPAKQTRSGRCQLVSQLCTALHWHDKRHVLPGTSTQRTKDWIFVYVGTGIQDANNNVKHNSAK